MITAIPDNDIFPLHLKVGLTKIGPDASLQLGDLGPVAAILDPEHYDVVIVSVSGLTQCLLTLAAAGSWVSTTVRRTKRRDMPEPSRLPAVQGCPGFWHSSNKLGLISYDDLMCSLLRRTRALGNGFLGTLTSFRKYRPARAEASFR